MKAALDALGIAPSMTINGTVPAAYPRVTQAAHDAGWEFMGHGFRQIATHLQTAGWTETLFQGFLNNKNNLKFNGWSRGSSPWLLDEPASFQDYWALRYFGRAFHEGINQVAAPDARVSRPSQADSHSEGVPAAASPRLVFRADISRPQWRRDSLDGLLDICVDHLATELPLLDPNLPWAASTEARFVALYDLLNAHPALVALRRERPWLGPRVLERLVEPALQANRKAGLTPEQSIRAYRQMYLFTLGCSVFVDHIKQAMSQGQAVQALK